MTTNNLPWQAIVNTNTLPESMTTANNLLVAQKENGTSTQGKIFAKKVVMPKRYSIDDNGGGYKGL